MHGRNPPATASELTNRDQVTKYGCPTSTQHRLPGDRAFAPVLTKSHDNGPWRAHRALTAEPALASCRGRLPLRGVEGVGHDPGRQLPHLDVLPLRHPAHRIEGLVCVPAALGHDDSLGLLDDRQGRQLGLQPRDSRVPHQVGTARRQPQFPDLPGLLRRPHLLALCLDLGLGGLNLRLGDLKLPGQFLRPEPGGLRLGVHLGEPPLTAAAICTHDSTIEPPIPRVHFPRIWGTWLASDTELVLILVGDASTRPPVHVEAGPDADSGRGLRLVEAMSDRCGWYPANAAGMAKVVWAEWAISPAASQEHFPRYGHGR